MSNDARDELERIYNEICGPSLVYHLTDADLADAILARWREARHDRAQQDVDAAADELRGLWESAK